ncbi:MAG TPA: META domain-containing protein [Agriterribacter sp.]|nr:META domain-containing protein [Agriterribacter sp.]
MKQGIMLIALSFLMVSVACKSTKVGNGNNSQSKKSGMENLDGSWKLEYISGPRIAFEGLYPDRKPVITFTVAEKRFGGNTSCNSFSGQLSADDKHIHFTDHMALTKMFCPGDGETVFLETLKKVNGYSVENNKLTFFMGEVPMMRFVKEK